MNGATTPGPRGQPGRPNRVYRSAAVALPLVVALMTVGVGCLPTISGAATSSRTPRHTTTPHTTTPPVTVWGQPAPTGSGVLEAVSCASADRCWAVGLSDTNALTAVTTTTAGPVPATIDGTTDGGVHWTLQPATTTNPTDLAAIDCPDVRHCMAVGASDVNGPLQGAVLTTVDGGLSWQELPTPTGTVDLTAVHCFGALDCTVLATDGSSYWSESTVDGGETWTRTGALPGGFGGTTSLSCVTTQICLTVGYVAAAPGQGGGAIALTQDGGTTWTAATLPTGIGVLHGITCTVEASCIAVGTKSTTTTDLVQAPSQVLISGDGGQTWTLSGSPSGLGDAFGVSCPTDENCAAVGTAWTPTSPPTPIGAAITSTQGAVSWHTPVYRYIPESLIGVDCPAPTACIAAGNDELARIALPAPKKSRATGGQGSGTTTKATSTGGPGRR